MPTPGTNLSYHNASQLWEVFFRKIGYKPKSRPSSQPTLNRNAAADAGTTFPRAISICAKYNVSTAPTTNAANDQPTGVGDICVWFAGGNVGLAHIDVANVKIYRCTAYTNTTTFTWAKIVD